MEFSFNVVLILIISSCPCYAEVSKACFGSPGLPCVMHNLECLSGCIAIQEAFNMTIAACMASGISNCNNINISSIPLTGTRNNISDKALDALYGECSTKSTCARRAERGGFSAILYQCIDETIDMCNVTNVQRTDTSLIWRGPSHKNTCVCSISKSTSTEPTTMTLTALEMRHYCQTLNVSKDGVTLLPVQCSQFAHYRMLFNSTDWENVVISLNTINSTNNSVIWIRIEGTASLSIVCNESPTTTVAVANTATTIESTTTRTTRTKRPQGTTPTISSVTSSGSSSAVPPDQTTTTEIGTEIIGTTTTVSGHGNNTKVHKDDESNTGTIAGIIVPFCILIAVVVTAVIIFRRRKLRQKEENGKATNPKSKPKEVYLMERKQSPDFDYATTNVYLDLVPEPHNNNSKHLGEADDDHYHQVEHLQTQFGFTKSNHSGGNKTKTIPHQTTKNGHAAADSTNGLYHELEPRSDNGSTDDDVASGMAGLVKSPARKGSSEYMLAGNITKQDKESQHAVKVIKGSSDYDYAGGNTYHVLEQQPPQKDSSDYEYAEENNYHEVEPQKGIQSSDYDYARCGDQQTIHNHHHRPNTEKRDSDYDHIGRRPARETGHYDTTVSGKLTRGNANEEVYSYNHLNERKASHNDDADSTYNTTASTRHRMDASTNDSEDDYGYNHLGPETKKNIPQNEYDTAASAIRDVARMNGEMEDSTYDHAHLVTQSGMTNAGFQESDYDHAFQTNTLPESESNAASLRSHQEEGGTDVYKLAQEAEANPYQLAK